MMAIRGIVAGGRVEVEVPAHWPDGTEVEVYPLAENTDDAPSSAEIGGTLAAMDQIKPFEMTDAEQAAWDAERRTRKEAEKARFTARAEEMRGTWE